MCQAIRGGLPKALTENGSDVRQGRAVEQAKSDWGSLQGAFLRKRVGGWQNFLARMPTSRDALFSGNSEWTRACHFLRGPHYLRLPKHQALEPALRVADETF